MQRKRKSKISFFNSFLTSNLFLRSSRTTNLARLPIRRLMIVLMQLFLIIATDRRGRIVFGTRLDCIAARYNLNERVMPVYRIDPIRRDHHFSAGQPIASVNDEIPNLPGFIVDQEIFHMSNLAVRCFDGISGNFSETAKVSVLASFSFFGSLDFSADCTFLSLPNRTRIWPHAPENWSGRPVLRSTGSVKEFVFVLLRDRLMRVELRTLFNNVSTGIQFEGLFICFDVATSSGEIKTLRPGSHLPVSTTKYLMAHCSSSK